METKFLKAYGLEITACAAAILFVGGMFLLGRMSATNNPCVGAQGEYSTCWGEHYAHLLETRGTLAALSDLKRRTNAGEGVALFCHPMLHEIGAHAAHEFGSVAEAFKRGDTFCRAGYYHGVLEGLFGEDGSEQLLSSLDSICAEIPGKERYSYDYFSCVHGIGHGLMAYFNHDVFESLHSCDRLSGNWEQHSCYGGVFMENILSDSPEMPSRFLKADDPLYPCNAVAGRYRTECYQMQSSHMLDMFAGDFAHTFAVCDSVEAEYRTLCYQSIGRDASGYAAGEMDTVFTLCAEGRGVDARTECLVGAAVDFIQSEGPVQAKALCLRTEESSASVCTHAVDMQLRAL